MRAVPQLQVPESVPSAVPRFDTSKSAREVDILVGRRIAERRVALGLTQSELAAQLGLSFQQVHKYERGINRVAAGRLYQIGYALGVTVSYFFPGLNDVRLTVRPLTGTERCRIELARAAEGLDESDIAALAGVARRLRERGKA